MTTWGEAAEKQCLSAERLFLRSISEMQGSMSLYDVVFFYDVSLCLSDQSLILRDALMLFIHVCSCLAIQVFSQLFLVDHSFPNGKRHRTPSVPHPERVVGCGSLEL